MRLLNTQSQKLVEFFGSDLPQYAILSHTLGDNEVTIQDLRSGQCTKQEGYAKIQHTLKQALKDDLEWAWIDTCCIDKTSSAEISEAVNSMFNWYTDARIYYAYLSDVKYVEGSEQVLFTESRWYTRGWTLQESIAPRKVGFFDCEWTHIASRTDVVETLANKTGIAEGILSSDRPYLP